MSILTTDEKSDTLRIPISQAYREGREAFAKGLGYYDANPYRNDRYKDKLDWWVGFSDAADGVSVEFRNEAEENGERI